MVLYIRRLRTEITWPLSSHRSHYFHCQRVRVKFIENSTELCHVLILIWAIFDNNCTSKIWVCLLTKCGAQSCLFSASFTTNKRDLQNEHAYTYKNISKYERYPTSLPNLVNLSPQTTDIILRVFDPLSLANLRTTSRIFSEQKRAMDKRKNI